MCLASYLIVVARSQCGSTPGSVLRDYFRMAAVYPLNFLITYAVIIFVYADKRNWNGRGVVFYVAVILESLGGLLNVITYALQSRVRSPVGRQVLSGGLQTASCRASASFRVGIGPPEFINVSFLE